MQPKTKYLTFAMSGFLLCVFLVLVFVFKPAPTDPRPDAINAYVQWSVYLLDGSPKACSLMEAGAKRLYIDSVPPSRDCPEAIRVTSQFLDLKEPFEPYAVLEGFRKNIVKIKVLDSDVVSIWSRDFRNAKKPIVFKKINSEWLVAKESFSSKKPKDFAWTRGRP